MTAWLIFAAYAGWVVGFFSCVWIVSYHGYRDGKERDK